MKRLVFAVTVVGLLIPSAFSKHAKVSDDLDTTRNKNVDVIVQFTHPAAQEQHDKVAKRNGKLVLELPASKAALYSMPASKLEDLADDSDVVFISPDRKVHADLEYAQPAVGADLTYNSGWDGSNVGIAIIDSGVNDHPDFKDRVNCSTSRRI